LLKESAECLKNFTDSTDSTSIYRNTLFSLESVESLSDIPGKFKSLTYYKLLTANVDVKLINRADEKEIVDKFKKQFVRKLFEFSDSAYEELAFLIALTEYLNTKDLQCIISNLKLEDFCCGNIKFS